nr:hypothetical protein [Tanacetum cinerariifolium]
MEILLESTSNSSAIVIEFSDSYKSPQEEAGKDLASESFEKKKGRTVVITTEDMQKRRNDVKVRKTLLLALPDEHQLRFSKYETAKELWEAILKTFGGNEATKKTKKNQFNQYGKGEVHTASILTASTQVSTVSADVAAISISHDTVCAYITSQSNGSRIKYKDITQIDKDDIEEIDIKWNMALLIKGGVLQLPQDGPFCKGDWSYMANKEENHALVADDEAPTEFALMAKSSTSSGNEVEARLVEFKTQEIKFYEKIRGLEFDVEVKNNKIEPSPSIESNTSDLQNSNYSVSEHEESSSSIMSKPMIKFVKAANSLTVIKTNKVETARKSSVKYAKMYRNTLKLGEELLRPQLVGFGDLNKTLLKSNLIMARLAFCDYHNMIAILEKSEHNIDFHQIVDFIEASYIMYALTINPTVYVSHIRQFWSTARIETTNEGTKILATVDGKPRTISESSIRMNLKLNDEEGISSLLYAKLVENLALMGYNILPNQKFTFQKDEHASLLRDDSQGEAFLTVSGLDELTDFCTGLQRQQTQMADKIKAQDLEISKIKARIKLLEDKDRGNVEPSGDDALIKGRSMEIGEEVRVERSTEQGSNDTEEMVNVLTSIEAANILTSGVAAVSVPPVAEVSTVGVPTVTKDKGKEKVVESEEPKKKKLQEQIDAQVAREIEEEIIREDQRMNEQLTRDAEIARLHAEEELNMMIEGLDRSNEMIKKHLQKYEQSEA